MSNSPQISLIIPVYNVSKFLAECLESVRAQTFTDWEIWAVDDGSADTCPQILADFAAREERVHVLTQPNSGVSAARKNGLSHARGKFVFFLDADDFLAPDYLSLLMEAQTRTQADLVVSPLVRYYAHSLTKTYDEMDLFDKSELAGEDKVQLFSNFSSAMALCGKLIRRDLWQQADLQFPTLRTGDDILPSVQLTVCAKKIALVQAAEYLYRQARPTSQSSSGAGRFKGLFEGFLRAAHYLKSQQKYAIYACQFERVRWICLTSFIGKYGLTQTEWNELLQQRTELMAVSRKTFAEQPWKLRAKVALLKFSLRTRIPFFLWIYQGKRLLPG